MRKYEEPKLEVEAFAIEDIITVSGDTNTSNPGNETDNMPF